MRLDAPPTVGNVDLLTNAHHNMSNKRFITISELAEQTGLPIRWLLREADGGRFPCLRAGQRRLFDPDAVRRALASRAKREAVRRA